MTTAADPQSLGERLAEHVAKKASSLQKRYRDDDASAAAELALLRRGVSKPLGSDARLAGLTLAGLYDNPAALSDDPQDAERAAYSALTLFALHQQSQRNASMHRRDFSFGRSARLLGRKSNARDAVRQRFTTLATAISWDETMHHARGLIQQMRTFAVPLDYGLFARDLYGLQSPQSADRVRLVWGRNFYRVHHSEDDEPSDAEPQTDAPADDIHI